MILTNIINLASIIQYHLCNSLCNSFYCLNIILYVGVRSGKHFVLTLVTGIIFGFISAYLLITSTKNVPYIFNWFSGGLMLSRDPHHYSDLESEVVALYFASF